MAVGRDGEEAVATDHRQPLHPEAAAGSAHSTTTREGTDASPGPTSTWLPALSSAEAGIGCGKAEGAVQKSSLDVAFKLDPKYIREGVKKSIPDEGAKGARTGRLHPVPAQPVETEYLL